MPGEQPAPGRRVVKLNTNENPYPPSPRVLDAVRGVLDGDLRRYPDPEAHGLRARAAALYGVPVDHVMAGNGSDELLALLLRATIDPGDRVAYPVPTYSLYGTLVAVQGGTSVTMPWAPGWALPADALRAARARLVFVCNPNAPSGSIVPIDVIAAFAASVPDTVVVVDEAYVDFADAHALGLVGNVPNVVVLRSFSKSFAMAGLRLGLCFGHPELLRGLGTVKDSYNLNRLTQAAGEAALDDVAWMRGNVARIRATRDALAQGMARLGYTVLPSHTNFVLARRDGVDQAPVQKALAAEGIFVRHFAQPGLEDALRVSVGTDDETAAFLDALAAVLGPDPRR